MTTLDIETFFAVLDHGTMTAAAEALFITQPTLTARIQALEAEVGAALFRRGKGQRHITLTEAGQRFLPLARRWQNLLKETQTFSSVERREFLHIIAVYTANQYILPPVYQRFLERGLPVSLWVESMRTYETAAAVARGDADMAIVDGDLHYDLQIEARPLFRESFFLVVPMDLALPDTVHPSMLRVEDEILVSGQPEILQWHDCWYGMDARPLLYTDIPQLAETLPSCGRRSFCAGRFSPCSAFLLLRSRCGRRGRDLCCLSPVFAYFSRFSPCSPLCFAAASEGLRRFFGRSERRFSCGSLCAPSCCSCGWMLSVSLSATFGAAAGFADIGRAGRRVLRPACKT
mgnify:CR=1 FL=1